MIIQENLLVLVICTLQTLMRIVSLFLEEEMEETTSTICMLLIQELFTGKMLLMSRDKGHHLELIIVLL